MDTLKVGLAQFISTKSSPTRPKYYQPIEPLGTEEKLVIAEINHQKVREERQNLDVAGHYSRPDVLQLKVNRERQMIIKISE